MLADGHCDACETPIGCGDCGDCAAYSAIVEKVAKLEGENWQLRQALLPFAAAAGRPGRLTDCTSGQPLPDDAILGLGVKVSAWKKAAELTGP